MEKNFIFLEIQHALDIRRNNINNTNNTNNTNNINNTTTNTYLPN